MSEVHTPGQDVTIRPARPEDADILVRITAEVFEPVSIDAKIEKMLGRPGASWQEIKAQAVRKELKDYPRGSFVAERGGQVIGYVTTVINKAASRGVIANVAVSAGAQAGGVGRRLLERAIDHFRQLGLAHAKIETLACNDVGQHLYPALGFREVVRQIHYAMPLRQMAVKSL